MKDKTEKTKETVPTYGTTQVSDWRVWGKTTKNLNHDSRPPGQKSNMESQEYEAEVLAIVFRLVSFWGSEDTLHVMKCLLKHDIKSLLKKVNVLTG
jgi:hypothetical protein